MAELDRLRRSDDVRAVADYHFERCSWQRLRPSLGCCQKPAPWGQVHWKRTRIEERVISPKRQRLADDGA